MLIYPNLFMSTLLWEEMKPCCSNLYCFSNVQNVITNSGVNILELKWTKNLALIPTLQGTSMQEMCRSNLQIIWNSNLPKFSIKSPPPRPRLPKINKSRGYVTATILNFKSANILNLENPTKCYLQIWRISCSGTIVSRSGTIVLNWTQVGGDVCVNWQVES